MPGYTNAFELAAELDGWGARAAAKAVTLTRHHAMLLQTRIQANASGRPGPNAPTGDYRRSWTTTVTGGFGGVVGVVGTNKPQARRLEYGFYGVDILGRHYNQPPFPHVGPAADVSFAEYEAGLGEILELGGGA